MRIGYCFSLNQAASFLAFAVPIFQVAAVVEVCYIGRQTSKVKVAFVTRLKHAMQKGTSFNPLYRSYYTKNASTVKRFMNEGYTLLRI